jgi:hypothetical protein
VRHPLSTKDSGVSLLHADEHEPPSTFRDAPFRQMAGIVARLREPMMLPLPVQQSGCRHPRAGGHTLRKEVW